MCACAAVWTDGDVALVASEACGVGLLHVHLAVGGVICSGEEQLDARMALQLADGMGELEAVVPQLHQFVHEHAEIGVLVLGRAGPGDDARQQHALAAVPHVLRQVEHHEHEGEDAARAVLERRESVAVERQHDVVRVAVEQLLGAEGAIPPLLRLHHPLPPADALVQVDTVVSVGGLAPLAVLVQHPTLVRRQAHVGRQRGVLAHHAQAVGEAQPQELLACPSMLLEERLLALLAQQLGALRGLHGHGVHKHRLAGRALGVQRAVVDARSVALQAHGRRCEQLVDRMRVRGHDVPLGQVRAQQVEQVVGGLVGDVVGSGQCEQVNKQATQAVLRRAARPRLVVQLQCSTTGAPTFVLDRFGHGHSCVLQLHRHAGRHGIGGCLFLIVAHVNT